MWIKTVRLVNFGSFKDSGGIEFSKSINVLTGQNNAGKSLILKSILQMQHPSVSVNDIRKGEENCEIKIKSEEFNYTHYPNINKVEGTAGPTMFIRTLHKNKGQTYSQTYRMNIPSIGERDAGLIPSTEPHNFIYPSDKLISPTPSHRGLR
ncbi:MAG: AAA family ATPase [Nitrospirae bacterium]|nr:AAA family ATPase [Nitrospirota bacterium]